MPTKHEQAAGSRVATQMTLAVLLAACSGSDGTIQPQADALSVGEGGAVTSTADGASSLMANDVGLSAAAQVDTTPLVAPQFGTLELSADGSFRYTHDGSEVIRDIFRYQVTDGDQTGWADVVIAVDPDDDPPVANDDLFPNLVGNTWLAVGRTAGTAVALVQPGSLLDNDTDPDGVLQVTDYDEASAEGGQVLVEPDGRFRYLPPVGFTGSDTFGYEVSDGHDVATAIVTLVVQNMVWYVDNAATEVGDGTAAAPFRDFQELSGPIDPPPSEGRTVYVRGDTGGGVYQGPLWFAPGMKVFGSGAAFEVGDLSLPAAVSPRVTTSENGAPGVVFREDSELHGFLIEDCGGPALTMGLVGDDPGSGTVLVREVGIDTGGAAVDFQNGMLDVELTAVVAGAGADSSVHLRDCQGRFIVTGDVVLRPVDEHGFEVLGGLGETGVDVRVLGETSVIGGQAHSISLQGVLGPVTFADVTISGRGDVGISVVGNQSAVTFADVDVGNEDQDEAAPVECLDLESEVRFASLDVDGADMCEPGLHVSAASSEGGVVVTGEGAQGDGGTIRNIAGRGIELESGSMLLADLSITEVQQQAILASSDGGTLGLARCNFTLWDGAGQGDVSIQFTLGADTDLAIALCEFDGTDVSASTGAVRAMVVGGNVSILFGGDSETEPGIYGNTLTSIRGSGLQVVTMFGGFELDVVGGSFEYAEVADDSVWGSAVAVVMDDFGSSASVGMRGVKVTGPAAAALDVMARAIDGPNPEGGGGSVIAIDAQDNELSGTLGAFVVRAEDVGDLRVALRDNTAVDLDQTAVSIDMMMSHQQSPMQVLIEREQYGYRADPQIGSAPVMTVRSEDQALIAVHDCVVSGLQENDSNALDVLGSVSLEQELHCSIEDNDFGGLGVLLDTSATGALVQAEFRGNTGGDFAIDHDSQDGIYVEELQDFTTLNPGCTLQVLLGTVIPLAPFTVELPDGPWR